MSLHLRRARRVEGQQGFTLVELLVSMTILGIFFSVFTGVIATVFENTRRQQDRSISVDASRNIVQVIDRQVRYANGIYEPKTAADGTQWVVWSSRNRQGVQTCHQWQVTRAGVMRWASWQAGVNAPLAFSTAGTGIGRRGTDDVFSLTDAGATIQTKQRLTLSFLSGPLTGGRDASATRVAFTALNTSSAALPSTLVCQEHNLP